MNNKKKILILIALIVVGVTLFLRIKEMSSTSISLTSISKNQFLENFRLRKRFYNFSIFIAFNPDCEHCQYEAKSINERKRDFAVTNIVMFTEANDSLVKSFSKQYGLDSLKNVQVISDTTQKMDKVFEVKQIPTILIYNKNNELVKRYNGETKIDAIIKYIQ